jgi:hypothetical protein
VFRLLADQRRVFFPTVAARALKRPGTARRPAETYERKQSPSHGRHAGGHVLYREDIKSTFGGIAGGRSLGLLSHELPRRRFSIAVSTWQPTDIWYSRRYCARRGSSSAKWWVSGCCVSHTASCAASPMATRKSSSFMSPRSRPHDKSSIRNFSVAKRVGRVAGAGRRGRTSKAAQGV